MDNSFRRIVYRLIGDFSTFHFKSPSGSFMTLLKMIRFKLSCKRITHIPLPPYGGNTGFFTVRCVFLERLSFAQNELICDSRVALLLFAELQCAPAHRLVQVTSRECGRSPKHSSERRHQSHSVRTNINSSRILRLPSRLSSLFNGINKSLKPVFHQ